MMLMQIADTNVLILMPQVMVRKILMLIKLLIFIDVLMLIQLVMSMLMQSVVLMNMQMLMQWLMVIYANTHGGGSEEKVLMVHGADDHADVHSGGEQRKGSC